jgi:hypothetical protein
MQDTLAMQDTIQNSLQGTIETTIQSTAPQTMQEAVGDLLQTALDSADEAMALDPGSHANAMVFVLLAAAGVLMALVYVPVRLFLTITARSRRLRLLQRIRRLREELGQPVTNA